MKVDWERAHEYPKKRQKIEGKYLLDLRSKIYELEQDIAEKDKEIDQHTEKLMITERSFTQLTEKFISSEKNLNQIVADLKAKLRTAETKILEQDTTKEKDTRGGISVERMVDLEQKIVNKDNELMRVKYNLEKTTKDVEILKSQLNQIIATKDQEVKKIMNNLAQTNQLVESLKYELTEATSGGTNIEIEKFRTEIEQKSKQIEISKQDLEYAISTKDKIIEKLERDLEAKIEKISELTTALNSLTQTNSTGQDGSPNILSRIAKQMALKGFVSEKEWEQMVKNNE
jgi:chromosome segregation ATPase